MKPVLRFAPSPTGYLHLGNLATCLCDYMLARSMNGKCLIRIEDTDQKREIAGAAEQLIATLKNFGITFDNEKNIPYQSKRVDIYKKYADKLLKSESAYVAEGATRLKLQTSQPQPRIEWTDLVKGEMSLPPVTDRDPVIVKSNGIPPYNLAHIVDDTEMGTTHVVRGEDWLPSTAEHIQIHRAVFGKNPPWHYAHLPLICIIDAEDGNKRKLSKRKDHCAIAQNLLDDGYPTDAIIEYLLTIYNTDYELWRTANPKTPWRDFPFRFEKIGSNSPLFDWDKLNHISSTLISHMTCKEINKAVKDFFKDKLTEKQLTDICTLLSVDRETERPRKDITKFSDILTEFDYIFRPVKMTKELTAYATLLAPTKEEWFENVKSHCEKNNLKVRDYTQQIRVALTGREKSTDLYTISKLLLQ